MIALAIWGISVPQTPVKVSMAPAFSVVDLSGSRVTESAFRGKTTVLFSFCGCRECRLVAEEWAKHSTTVQTLACYSGEAAEVGRMAKAWPGKPGTARFLVDPEFQIADRYKALPCPAAYVVDGQGRLRYSSKESLGETEANARLIVDQVTATISDVAAGKPVIVAPKPIEIPSPLVPVAGGENRKQNDQTLETIIVAPNADKETVVERDFQFLNPSKKPVKVDKVVASCGCEQTGLVVGGSMVQSAMIGVGRTATVRVRMKVAPHFSGQKMVQAWLMTNGSSLPLGTVQINLQGR